MGELVVGAVQGPHFVLVLATAAKMGPAMHGKEVIDTAASRHVVRNMVLRALQWESEKPDA
jgi:hypothetical protein